MIDVKTQSFSNLISGISFSYKKGYQFDIKTQLDFVRQLSSYTKSGLNMKKSLQLTKKNFEHSYGKNHLTVILCEELLQSINKGEYEKVLKKYFHPNIAMCYEVMNYTTNKNAVLEVTGLVKVEKDLIKDFMFKFLSPIFIFLGGMISMFFVGGTLLPKILDNYRGDTEPKITLEMQLCMSIADFLSVYGLYIFVTLLFSLVSLKWILPNLVPNSPHKKAIRSFLDSNWPFSLYKNLWAIRVIKLFGILKSSNMREKNIIELIKFFTPPFCTFYLDIMSVAQGSGSSKKEYFLKGLLSKNQEVRLSPYFTHCSNEEFSEALIVASNDALVDVDMQFKSASRKYSVLFLVIGALCFLVSSAAIFDISFGR
ncbi:hypothetical protein [Pseudoalteromonas luteoviolacea]|uniref:Type II secretion system protein GspF domain-containing protein n=1 Tax=Pseudoalteromonas luteoviolacea S4060-1 TaxID=1365257 RepID=A0A162AXQ0_9GAMM|nr:hypothetical protein [Pseudoalteromonas luteoviolacea]KZN63392.1 hypothetical protein N478_03825 [Pseudoalteromonas luteoviolacea S4060-1]